MSNVSLPKLMDYMNETSLTSARMFIDPYVLLFGSTFWGVMVCVVGLGIWIKTERVEPMLVWFLVSCSIGYPLFENLSAGDPMGSFLYVIGIIVGVGIGILLYKVFIASRG